MRFARVLLVLCLLLPPAARAIVEPDVVYARFHQGLLAGNVQALLENAAEPLRSELGGLPAAQRDATMKMLAMNAPASYVLRGKNVAPDGGSARLVLVGSSRTAGGRPETLYGKIQLVTQRGTWRVARAEWDTERPADLGAAPPPGAAPSPVAAPPGAPKPAAAPKAAAQALPYTPPPKGSAPMVGSMDAAPVRKLGQQQEPCVFKPVMTAEDLERCR
jgi:hypothetical protein